MYNGLSEVHSINQKGESISIQRVTCSSDKITFFIFCHFQLKKPILKIIIIIYVQRTIRSLFY